MNVIFVCILLVIFLFLGGYYVVKSEEDDMRRRNKIIKHPPVEYVEKDVTKRIVKVRFKDGVVFEFYVEGTVHQNRTVDETGDKYIYDYPVVMWADYDVTYDIFNYNTISSTSKGRLNSLSNDVITAIRQTSDIVEVTVGDLQSSLRTEAVFKHGNW